MDKNQIIQAEENPGKLEIKSVLQTFSFFPLKTMHSS